MARTFARIKASVWVDDDWKQLAPLQQWAYVLLLSQPQINNCGVLPYVVTRWARLATGLTIDDVTDLMHDLDQAGYVILDEETAEVLVRSFVKHDEIEKQPNLRKAAVRQFDEIQSPRIRASLAREYPHLFNLTKPHEQADPEPLPEDLREPLPEDLREPDSNPRARVGPHQRTASGIRQPATSSPTPAPTPRAAAEALEAAGWTPRQIEAATHDLDRAHAWLTHAHADPTTKKPGALAWQKWNGTQAWPDTTRPSIANGAQGTRSTSPPLPHRPAEPDLERIQPPADFLALAGRTPEPPAPPAPKEAA